VSDEAAWTPGSVIEGHRLVRVLGRGGMGEVWLVEHVATGAARALKVLRGAFAPEDVTRFRREVEALSRVDGHPNLVRVHAAGVHARCPWVVMERVPGGDLQARLEAGPLEPSLAASLVRDLARGVAHAHAHGALHRDLKPANVLLDERGAPVLVDFGLARLHGAERLTQTGTVVGTPAYMAPEQARGDQVDERADVYGLGAIFYHTLCGQPPFSGSGPLVVLAKVCEGRLAPPRSVRAGIPRELEAICLRALALDPGARWASAGALGAALDEWLARGGRPPRSRPTVLQLLGGAALLAVVAGTLAARPTTTPPSPTPTSPTPPRAPDAAGDVAPPVSSAPALSEWAGRFARGEHAKATQRPSEVVYGGNLAQFENIGPRLRNPETRRDAIALLETALDGGDPTAQRHIGELRLDVDRVAGRELLWKASRDEVPEVRAGILLALDLILGPAALRDLEGAALLLAEAEGRLRKGLVEDGAPAYFVEVACGFVLLGDAERAVEMLDTSPDPAALPRVLERRAQREGLEPCARFLEGVAWLRGWGGPIDPAAASRRFTELTRSAEPSVRAAAARWLEQLPARRLTWAERFERESRREQVRARSSFEAQLRLFNRDLRAELASPALREQALKTLEEGIATGNPVCQKLLGEELLRAPQGSGRARGLHLLWRASRDPTPDQQAGLRLAFELLHGPAESRDPACARLLLGEAEGRARQGLETYEPAFLAELVCELVHVGEADRAVQLIEDAPGRAAVFGFIYEHLRGERDPLLPAAVFLDGVALLRGWRGQANAAAARARFESLRGGPDPGVAAAAAAWATRDH
jgi:serine/threonine protein kinase